MRALDGHVEHPQSGLVSRRDTDPSPRLWVPRDVADQHLHKLANGFSCVTTMTRSFVWDGYDVAR
jgi:hypothetical protein